MQSLRAGLARADITPPVGTKMAGYIRRKQVSQGINDSLFAKALYLNSGETQAALVVLDTCLLDQKLVSMARAQVEQATGLPGDHVNIAATHTHSGPSGLGLLSFGGGYDQALLEFVASQITVAVAHAKESAFKARLKAGSTVVEGITLNRRDPERPVDQRLRVLCVEDDSGRLRGVLVNYPCHATFLNYDNLMISADWPGATCSVVERVVGDEVIVLVTIGASGDVHPLYLS
ncbi:MAG: neutral/alkaline non-lysosomal ceramidase N-terminal domain-containing protein [Anaerolineae bacterium]